MRTRTLRPLVLAALAGSLLFATACKRDKDAAPDEDITSAEDHSDGERETAFSADIVSAAAPQDETQTGSAAVSPEAIGRVYGRCATRTYNADARTLTIDFGPTNCLCPDGKLRRGKIVVVFTGSDLRRHSGAVVTRENYFVNDNQHTATRIFTGLGNGSFSVAVTGASIIFANNGGTSSWTANRTCTMTAGFGTPQVSDDVYSVVGQAQGTNRRGVSYTATVGTPLIKRGDCYKYFTAGTVTIANSNGKTLLLNYDPSGTGGCDNVASVTVNGRTKIITLR